MTTVRPPVLINLVRICSLYTLVFVDHALAVVYVHSTCPPQKSSLYNALQVACLGTAGDGC